LTRGGQTVLSGDTPKDIISNCVCNFSGFVGTLPPGPSDPLHLDGLKSFARSIQATCQATPSLGVASAGVVNEPTGAGGAIGSATTASALAATDLALVSVASSAPSVTVATVSNSSSPSYAPSINPITTAAAPVWQAPTPTVTTSAAALGGGSQTITALSQLFTTNCLQSGCI